MLLVVMSYFREIEGPYWICYFVASNNEVYDAYTYKSQRHHNSTPGPCWSVIEGCDWSQDMNLYRVEPVDEKWVLLHCGELCNVLSK